MTRAWQYTVRFADTAAASTVRQVIFWIELLLRDPAARAHMARYAEPPTTFQPRVADAGALAHARVITLATDEEIDDFGE